jgi:hypothetical protein
VSAASAFEQLVTEIERGVAEPRVAGRLALVGVTSVLKVRDTDLACTLVFQEPKPEVLDGEQASAEVVIELTPDGVESFWDKPLAMQIFNGDVHATGPVRRVLAVFPVLRAVAKGGRDMRSEQPDLP